MPACELIERAQRHRDRVAIVDASGVHRYDNLLLRAARVADRLLAGGEDLAAARVAFLVPPSASYVALQWGIWSAGGVAVPLAMSHPAPELARVLADAMPRAVIAGDELRPRLEAALSAAVAENAGAWAGAPVLSAREVESTPSAATSTVPIEVNADRRAMMIYTSGTTGRPKGVVSTHATVAAQITTLVEAWEWRPDDRILHVLPLHHVHGVINALGCALWVGATCEFLTPFDAVATWERLASGEITLFMTVPTVYRRLVATWEEADAETRRRWTAGARKLRLMVSGSAALPVATLERWEAITGHRLLERYGMTEIGMGLGNPLHGERRAGTVGVPFPGVEARVVDEGGGPVATGQSGQIEIRGVQVFLEYWRRPDASRECFHDGWFQTGDEGVIEDGYWRILGRRSVDIIKTGGYKVSALEIEETLRQHAAIADAAVVGVADEDWGERVCAALILSSGARLELSELRAWCKERMAPYKAPRQIEVVNELPCNALGKVVKPALTRLFAPDEDATG